MGLFIFINHRVFDHKRNIQRDTMFGSIGGFEMLVLVAIGLLVFGPRKLPEIGRTLGKVMAEFRRAALDLRTSIEREVNLEELEKTRRSLTEEVNSEIREMKPSSLLPAIDDEPEETPGSARTSDAAPPDDAVKRG